MNVPQCAFTTNVIALEAVQSFAVPAPPHAVIVRFPVTYARECGTVTEREPVAASNVYSASSTSASKVPE